MSERCILVTGGAGFIGSNLVRYWTKAHPSDKIAVLDLLTYAGHFGNIADLIDSGAVEFHRADIADAEAVAHILDLLRPDLVFHLAAETHVDRSIQSAALFVRSNVLGTTVLIEALRSLAETRFVSTRLVLMSTDEVYGPAPKRQRFDESSPYRPSSPYAASKAAADHFGASAHRTWGMDIVLAHPTNNYGPRQFPEKLIPLMIRNAAALEPLPIYGSGLQERDWLFVEDTCKGLDRIAHAGKSGQHYNLGTGRETPNLIVVEAIADQVDQRLGRPLGTARALITHIQDRPGHDIRYALDCTKVASLGWQAETSLEQGLQQTVQWYLDHPDWLDEVTSGTYRRYYEEMYASRLQDALDPHRQS